MINTATGDRTALKTQLVDTFSQIAATAAATQPVQLLTNLREATAVASEVTPATVATQVSVMVAVLSNRQADLPADQVYSLVNALLQNIINGLAALVASGVRPAGHGGSSLQAQDSLSASVQLYGVVRSSINTVSSSLLTVPGDSYNFAQSGLSTTVQRVPRGQSATASLSAGGISTDLSVDGTATSGAATVADVSLVLAPTNPFASAFTASTRATSAAATVYIDDASTANVQPAAFGGGVVRLTIPATCTASAGRGCRFRCFGWDPATLTWTNSTSVVTTETVADQTTSASNVPVVCRPQTAGTYAVLDASTASDPENPASSSSGTPVALIAGVVVAIVVVALIIFAVVRRRNKNKASGHTGGSQREGFPSYDQHDDDHRDRDTQLYGESPAVPMSFVSAPGTHHHRAGGETE
jgi:hypothetical protein